MATYHVRPRPPGNPDEWAVEKRGASRASAVKSMKAAAAGAARSIADEGDTIVIHDSSGSVMKRNTVGGGTRQAKKGMRRNMGSSPFDY